MTLQRNNLDKHKSVINTFYITFKMKVPTLKNNIDEFKPIFKSWNEMSQKVSTKYGTNSLGEMAFWHDVLYLHDIYTTSHCRKLSCVNLEQQQQS